MDIHIGILSIHIFCSFPKSKLNGSSFVHLVKIAKYNKVYEFSYSDYDILIGRAASSE